MLYAIPYAIVAMNAVLLRVALGRQSKLAARHSSELKHLATSSCGMTSATCATRVGLVAWQKMLQGWEEWLAADGRVYVAWLHSMDGKQGRSSKRLDRGSGRKKQMA